MNIAMELVTDPVILFLDEPTSGLAADDTTALVQLLADLAQANRQDNHHDDSPACQRRVREVQFGVDYGPRRHSHLSTGHDRRLPVLWVAARRQGKPKRSTILATCSTCSISASAHLRGDAGAKSASAAVCGASTGGARMECTSSSINKTRYSRRCIRGVAPSASARRSRGSRNASHPTAGQFRLLVSRYMKTKMRDVGGRIMLLQAPIIGLLLAAVFGGQKNAIPYWCLGRCRTCRALGGLDGEAIGRSQEHAATADNSAAIFFLVVAAVWFGTSNAAREIVSEKAIYVRERMVNLKLVNYVLSKFVLLSLFCVIQCTVLLAIAFFALGFSGGPMAFGYNCSRCRDRDVVGGHGAAAFDDGHFQRSGHGAYADRADSPRWCSAA